MDLRTLDERGLLGESPSPTVIAAVTFFAVVAVAGGMFAVGRLDSGTPGVVLGLVAVAGIALAVGAALATLQYRWAEQLELAQAEQLQLVAEVERERDHHRTVVHDAKADVAALGAAVHALRRRPDAKVVDALDQQIGHLRAVLDQPSITPEPFHLSDVFDGLGAFTALHDIELKVRPTDAMVVGDADATLQILQNLVDNSRKYAPGSAIRVWTESAGAAHTLVVLEDDGPGIEPGASSGLFEPGVRRTSGTQGFGMGLASARRLVEAQGAAIWYDDEWTGARFVVKFKNAEPR